MDIDAPDFSDWPNGNVYLVPNFLTTLQQRLMLLRTEFRHFTKKQDPAVGFDLDWLLVHICEPAFLTIEFIAQQAPPITPADPVLVGSTSVLASQLQAVIGDGETADFLSQIEALPNSDWDDVFKGYCRVLEASVDAYLIGDSPAYKVKLANASAPDLVFRILRDLIGSLGKFPFLRPYQNRLMKKLEGSRSGAIYTQFWMKHIPLDSEPGLKRKIDTPDLDGPAKKGILGNVNVEIV